MRSVFLLFLIPVGGGIPAGVLMAQSRGLSWWVVALLYFASDVVQALLMEPVLRGLAWLASKVPTLARMGSLMKQSMAQEVNHASRWGRGPLTLVLVSFLVDPITGRAVAMAADYGWLGGWAIAIAGDMLYFGVVAAATLGLRHVLPNPEWVVGLVLVAMVLGPRLLSRPGTSTPVRPT